MCLLKCALGLGLTAGQRTLGFLAAAGKHLLGLDAAVGQQLLGVGVRLAPNAVRLLPRLAL